MKKFKLLCLIVLSLLIVTLCAACGSGDETDKPEQVEIEFVLDGESYKTVNLTKGFGLGGSIPEVQKEGYRFSGWFDSESSLESAEADGLLDPMTIANQSMTFYGKMIKVYSLELKVIGSDESEIKTVDENAELARISIYKKGYKVVGRYYDEAKTEELSADARMLSDTTIWLDYDVVTYKLTYSNLNGATVDGVTEFTVLDAPITLVAPKGYYGRFFRGYKYAGGTVTEIDTSRAADITVTATWSDGLKVGKDDYYDYCDKAVNNVSGSSYLFGAYPKSLKEDGVTITSVTDSKGYYLGSDGWYYKKYDSKYYKIQPLKWNVTNKKLIADSVIDCEQFNISETDTSGSGLTPNRYSDSTLSDFVAELIEEALDSAQLATLESFISYDINRDPIEGKTLIPGYTEAENLSLTATDYAKAKGAAFSSVSGYASFWTWGYDSTGKKKAYVRNGIEESMDLVTVTEKHGVVPVLQASKFLTTAK